jgi:hypothetical protein
MKNRSNYDAFSAKNGGKQVNSDFKRHEIILMIKNLEVVPK